MIELTRCLARQLKDVLRRCVRKNAVPVPVLTLQTDALGWHARLHHGEVAAAFHQDGGLGDQVMQLPLVALDDFEGRSQDLVALEPGDSGKVIARWQDAGVPQVVEYQVPDQEPVDFPAQPDAFAANPPEFLQALQEAVKTAGSDNVRYAVTRLMLRGKTGEVIATDGRQLLVQGGFTFPWTEDVLIPSLAVFGCKELKDAKAVEIGKTDTHAVLRIGSWTLYLHIDKDGRFPAVESVIPTLTSMATDLQLDRQDADFLARALPRLPGQDDDFQPLTIDLNGQVSIRARAADQGRTTEVVLARSSFTGPPLRVCLNRQHLARMLHLGLTSMKIGDPNAPLLCTADKRTFVCMMLDPKIALGPSEEALRIASADTTPTCHTPSPPKRRKTVPMPPPENHAETVERNNQPPVEHSSNGTGFNALIDEAEALRTELRAAYGRATRLLATVKRQRRQSKALTNTLASLRQLQRLAA